MSILIAPGRWRPALACVLLAAGAAAAQTPERASATPIGPNSELTIDRAVEVALARNPELAQAIARMDRVRGNLKHARVPVPSNPEVEVAAANRDPGSGGASSTDLEIRLSQEFWIGGQGGLRRRIARSEIEGQRAMVGFFRLSVAARARAAFLEFVVARESVATARRAVEVARTIRDAARTRLETGEGTRIEDNTARIGLGRAQAALATAKAEASRARAALAAIMGVALPAELKLDRQINPAPLELPERTQLLNRVARQRSDLNAAAAEVAAAEESLDLSRRLLVPNLTAFGFYSEEEGDQITGAGVSLPLPLWHRFGGERQKARADLEAAQIKRDRLLLDIRVGMERAVTQYRAARERIQAVGEQMLRAAEDNVELVFEAFKAGQVGIMAVATAQESLLQARNAYLESQRAFVRAARDLERTSGGLLSVHDASVVRPETNAAEAEQNETEQNQENSP